MHVPPFHRRILPWVFAVCFLAIAPVVIFYTAGYRYNAKKGQIERNGTVIIDSRPRSASITVDGRALTDITPITLQNMAPGNHLFDVRRNGYTSWSKTLDVRPEYVTFLNTIRLWKVSEPQLLTTSTVDLISWSPNDDYLLVVSMEPTPAYRITDARGNLVMSGKMTPPPSGKMRAVWQTDGSAALLTSDAAPWLLDTGRSRQAMALPEADYRFSKSELVGNNGKALISIRLSDLSLRRTPLGDSADVGTAVQLRSASGTHATVMVLPGNPEEGIVLPDGDWTIALEERNDIILRAGSRWLSVQGTERPPQSHQASGDMLRPITISNVSSYLLIDGPQLWMWSPTQEPELLRRQSDTIVNAVWHYAGGDVFYATDKDVFSLNLDTRDGYLVTKLASFDHINDMTISTQGMIYVAGSKDGKDGVWTVATE